MTELPVQRGLLVSSADSAQMRSFWAPPPKPRFTPIATPHRVILSHARNKVQCSVATPLAPFIPYKRGQVEVEPQTAYSKDVQLQAGEKHKPWNVTPALLKDVVTMFSTQPYEFDYWVNPAWVTGQIPIELQGTYLRNGPGLQVATGKHQRHFMDGDGCVLSLAFPGNGQAPRFTNRYVRTKGFQDEQAAGKPVHRNAFTRGAADGSALFNPLDLNFKNVANTGILYWGGRMWALWEVGLPYELNPHNLETIGESTMDGQINQRLAGHYKVFIEADGSKRLILFGAQVSFSGMSLEFYELDEAGKVITSSQHGLKGMEIMFVHDMLMTEHWYVVVMGPVELDFKGFFTDYLMSKKSLAELLIYNKDRPSQVFLYPRPGKTPPTAAGPLKSHVLTAPPFFSFHHVNAYERKGGEEVVIDTISWSDIAFDVTQYTVTPEYYNGGCRSQLYRMVAHLPTSTVSSCERVVQRTVEFPTFNTTHVTGRPYKHAYFSSDAVNHATKWAPAQALLKVTLPIEDDGPSSNTHSRATTPLHHHEQALPHAHHLLNNIVAGKQQLLESRAPSSQSGDMQGVTCEEWRPGPRCFPQEVTFIPRPGGTDEDDGWLILGVVNAETNRGEVAILDAKKLSEGPVALIHLPHALPCGLHGAWTDEYLGPDPADVGVPAWRTPNKIKEL